MLVGVWVIVYSQISNWDEVSANLDKTSRKLFKTRICNEQREEEEKLIYFFTLKSFTQVVPQFVIFLKTASWSRRQINRTMITISVFSYENKKLRLTSVESEDLNLRCVMEPELRQFPWET